MKQLMLFIFLFSVISGCSDGNFKESKGYKSYGGKTYDSARSICPAPKRGYFLAGMSNSFIGNTIDGYLLKIDEKGREKFAYNYGGSGDDRFYKIISVKDGLLMCGYSDSDGAGLRDVYIVKTGFNGKLKFESRFGGAGNDEAAGMCETADGKIAVIGNSSSYSGANAIEVYFSLHDSAGKQLFSRTYGGDKYDFGMSIIPVDSGFVAAGRTSSRSKGSYDAFVMKLDASGNTLAYRTFGGTGYDAFEDITATSDGGFAAVGELADTVKDGNVSQVYLVKLDSNLNKVWEKAFGGKMLDMGKTIIEDNGNFVISGTTDSFGNGSSDIFLLKTDAMGNSLWMSTFGGRKDEYAAGAVKSPDGGYVVAGWTGTYGNGEYDAFAAKTDINGLLK